MRAAKVGEFVRRSLMVAIVVVAFDAGAATGVGFSTGATAPASLRVVVDHVDNPRGLFITRSGVLWATVAGRGGHRCANLLGRICWGRTGKVLRIAGGRARTFASGLASIRNYLGVVGADDVSVAPNGRVFTAMITDDGMLASDVNRVDLRGELGKLLRFDRRGHPMAVADVGRFELGHPYAVLALRGRELVTDSEQNTLLEVRGRRVRVLFRFPQGANGADSVPTALALGPDGAVYIGELSGIKAGAGQARIWRMVPGQKPQVYATGFSAVLGLAFGPDGSLYVCEFSRD
jgi:hypothetical protein